MPSHDDPPKTTYSNFLQEPVPSVGGYDYTFYSDSRARPHDTGIVDKLADLRAFALPPPPVASLASFLPASNAPPPHMTTILNMAPSTSKYSIILPTYNERRNLPIIIYLLCTTLASHSIDYEIIIVDDASPDGTLEVAKQLQTVWGSDRILLRPRAGKLGLGTAYVHGLESCTGDFVFIMDADFSHHPKDMPKMIEMQRERDLDIVQGTRYSGPSTGAGVYGWNLKRKLVSRGANLLASVFLDPKTTDVTGSFRLYRRPLLHRLIKEATSKGYVFQMEILVRARAMGATIGEVPITFCDRVFGDSKLEGGEIVGYATGVWNLWRAF